MIGKIFILTTALLTLAWPVFGGDIVYTTAADCWPKTLLSDFQDFFAVAVKLPYVEQLDSKLHFTLRQLPGETPKKLQFDVSGVCLNQKVKLSRTFYYQHEREAAQKLVDWLRAQLFDWEPICDSKILFVTDDARAVRNIFYCDLDGKNLRQITSFGRDCAEPDWAPDAQSIVYTKYTLSGTEILQTRLPDLASRRLCGGRDLNTGATVSLDGRQLALIASVAGQVDLYVKPLEDNTWRNLTSDQSVESSPCWSPDQKQLVFVSNRDGRPGLFITTLVSGETRKLTAPDIEAYNPDWRGDRLVYTVRKNHNYTLAYLNMSNGHSVDFAAATGDWETPSWSPDAKLAAAAHRNEAGETELCILAPNKENYLVLFKTRESLTGTSWSPRKR